MGTYSIWVLEYGYTSEFPKAITVHGAFGESIRFSYAYVLIKGNGHVAMVDVGYDNTAYGKVLNDRFGIENWHSPRDVLSACDVAPEDVSHVFVTHAHFDHFGGSEHFPNAVFYLQERELSKWIWAMALDRKFRWLTAAIDANDIMRAVNLAREGRLVCVDGAREDVLPGIDLFPAHDTHTAGCQYVLVRNDGRPESSDGWILAGDLVYRFENLVGSDENDPSYLPIGLATGSQTNLLLATDEMLTRVGGDPRRIIPVHEARLKDAFPSRRTAAGLHIVEVTLGAGQTSLVA
ncbi:N-acyl homoserine lactonase family protein [Rhodoligotrophos defluvii]|uniref:N-acyl homoserine lactonase family protein n=1 Tax=Rhodoligotrophos defluvii TaxID=2561934 RepID=UPI0010C9DDAE|nr:N-acyl homoserine lactonase family protein [Rhodoligotrophos defluvii]